MLNQQLCIIIICSEVFPSPTLSDDWSCSSGCRYMASGRERRLFRPNWRWVSGGYLCIYQLHLFFLFHIFSSFCCRNTSAGVLSIVSGIIAILVALLGIIGAIALSRILIGLVSYETDEGREGVIMGSNV